MHGKGGGAGVVLQPAPEGEAHQPAQLGPGQPGLHEQRAGGHVRGGAGQLAGGRRGPPGAGGGAAALRPHEAGMTPARVGPLRTPCLRQSVYRLSVGVSARTYETILIVQSGKCEMSSVFTYYLELLIVCIILTYDTLRRFGCYIKTLCC